MARHEADLGTRGTDGVTRREHLETAARMGSEKSKAALAGPPFPESLRYLWDRFLKLNGMRGVNMTGLARLTPMDIDAANRLLAWDLEPQEVDALIMLDLVTLHPEAKA